jgi:hypothetical protein
MEEVELLINSANARIKASMPEANSKPKAKKKSMDKFLQEQNV